MLEGFSDGGKVVESNITQLEACMRMVLDSDDGYAAPYVWFVYAGNKSYGTYVITDVNVDESIRNTAGEANRATVDVSFQQVSPYQVSSGIDITAEAISGGLSEKAEQQLQDKNNEKDNQENNVNNNNNSNSGKGNNSAEIILAVAALVQAKAATLVATSRLTLTDSGELIDGIRRD